MSYTERFSEVHALLAKIRPASYTTEQNTGYVDLGLYHRAVVICEAGVLGGGVDFDFEAAQDTSGTGPGSYDYGDKDFTWVATTDNGAVTVVEIRPEEFDVAGGDHCLNVECTPGGQGDIFAVQVWGIVPRYAPVSTAALDSVED